MSQDAWKQQLAAAIRRVEDLPSDLLGFLGEEQALQRVADEYPMMIPRRYLERIDPSDPHDPIARMVLPDPRELEADPVCQPDPLGEDGYEVVAGLIHHYRDRVLLLVTTRCASYCRFCTRKRLAGRGWGQLTELQLDAVVSYLEQHGEIREVILSGGDPLVLSDQALEYILVRIRSVPSVRMVRVGTRIPAVLPARITDGLARLLARHRPLFVVTHFDHPRELGVEARRALELLVAAGLAVVNQTVLLAGVNDDVEVLAELFCGLQELMVRPYYLHQCDLTQGTGHFRVPLDRGIELMGQLRQRVGGLCVPQYVVDLPGGRGKVPVIPRHVASMGVSGSVLLDLEGRPVSYPL